MKIYAENLLGWDPAGFGDAGKRVEWTVFRLKFNRWNHCENRPKTRVENKGTNMPTHSPVQTYTHGSMSPTTSRTLLGCTKVEYRRKCSLPIRFSSQVQRSAICRHDTHAAQTIRSPLARRWIPDKLEAGPGPQTIVPPHTPHTHIPTTG